MSHVIKLDNIVKKFRAQGIETTALNGLSLAIEEGEFVAIMGPSGSGKSTLLNVLGILDKPNSGTYELMGQDVTKASDKQVVEIRKNNIGFIFQSFNLIDELSVYDNVELPLLYKGLPANERKPMVEAALKKMSIDHRANHMPQQLSGGQQQRVAIARAVVTNPSLILADEPTGNLDSKNGKEVMTLLQQLNADGTSVVMVTHSPQHAAYAARRIHVIDGHLKEEHEAQAIAAAEAEAEGEVEHA